MKTLFMPLLYSQNLAVMMLLASVILATASCGRSTTSQAPASSDGAGQEVTVDIDKIFPPGEGRDLVLNNCQSCHVWVPIVILQMNKDEWKRNSLDHRDRVEGLSDQEFELLYDYLASTFTPNRPVPELPPALLEAWTAY